MRLQASDICNYFRPSCCEAHVHLRHRGEEEAPPSPYQEVLLELGRRHEQVHRETFM